MVPRAREALYRAQESYGAKPGFRICRCARDDIVAYADKYIGSPTGFTNDRLGVCYIKHFDQFCPPSQSGRYRILVFDGHGVNHKMASGLERVVPVLRI